MEGICPNAFEELAPPPGRRGTFIGIKEMLFVTKRTKDPARQSRN
jgi:hypothetical protein